MSSSSLLRRTLSTVALITVAFPSAQGQGRPCDGLELPNVAQHVFRDFFASSDTLISLARDERGVVKQPLTATHGVLKEPNACTRLRAALRHHLGATGQLAAELSNGDLPLSFFEFGDYFAVFVRWPDPPGVVLRGASAPLFIFRRNDFSYVARWDNM